MPSICAVWPGFMRLLTGKRTGRHCACSIAQLSSTRILRPPTPVPRTAAALPVVSADGKTWAIKVKPGIFFTDDPAFRGKRRELVAEDYVYSIKRYIDPNLRGGGEPLVADLIVGARPLVDAASKPGARFDYDASIDGLRALDRQFRFPEVVFHPAAVKPRLGQIGIEPKGAID